MIQFHGVVTMRLFRMIASLGDDGDVGEDLALTVAGRLVLGVWCWVSGAGARLVLADVAFRGAYGGGGVGGVSWACVGVGGCEVR